MSTIVSFHITKKKVDKAQLNVGMALWFKKKSFVVDPSFCSPDKTTLILQEQWDDFTITDADGKPMFKLDASMVSLRSSRALYDAKTRPVVEMRKKAVSLSGSWYLNKPANYTNLKGMDQDVLLAVFRPTIRLTQKVVEVFLNDGDVKEDFIIKGDFRAKHFKIVEAGGSERLFATIDRESRFASKSSFIKSVIMSNTNKYFLTIEPGVDAAFMVALTLLCDEIYNEAHSWR